MTSSTSNERLQIRFESPEELRSEFEKNISNGGIFVPTERDFSVRQPVIVEIDLGYDEIAGGSLSLDGEVVHHIPAEMAASGAVPGVAVQFEAPVDLLRQSFVPLLGNEVASRPAIEPDPEGSGRRMAKRGAVRVPVRVMPESTSPFEATSRDLSATGILLSIGEVVLPRGEFVRICLWHPNGEKSVEIDGQVVREVHNKAGRIAAVAIAFERDQAADPRVCEVIDALGQAGHRSRLGGISGSIEDLGLANLLQMFGASAPRGTVVCENDGEQGWVAFADGALLMAELGSLRGHEALVAMLDWPSGRFQFEATAEQDLVDHAERRPLAGAILEAVCAIDEQEAASRPAHERYDADANDADWAEKTFIMPANLDANTSLEILPETLFDVDPTVEEATRSLLGKVEEAVLDLVKSDMPVNKLLEVIPEDAQVIYAALQELLETGLLIPR